MKKITFRSMIMSFFISLPAVIATGIVSWIRFARPTDGVLIAALAGIFFMVLHPIWTNWLIRAVIYEDGFLDYRRSIGVDSKEK